MYACICKPWCMACFEANKLLIPLTCATADPPISYWCSEYVSGLSRYTAFQHTCMYTYIHSYLHIYIQEYIHSCIHGLNKHVYTRGWRIAVYITVWVYHQRNGILGLVFCICICTYLHKLLVLSDMWRLSTTCCMILSSASRSVTAV